MKSTRLKKAMGVLLAAAALAAFGCGSANAAQQNPRDERLPPKVILRGQVVLPPTVHPTNLYHERIVPQVGACHGMYMAGQHNMKMDHPMTSDAPAPPPPLSRILRVRAVAMPPPPEAIRNGVNGRPPPAIAKEFDGKVDDRGFFELAVPDWPWGWSIAASADKVQLKLRLRGTPGGNIPTDGLVVDVRSTIVADTAHYLGPAVASLPSDRVAALLGTKLEAQAALLADALQRPQFRRANWDLAARMLADPKASELFNPLQSVFRRIDRPTFNLLSTGEMPAGSATIGFGSASNQALSDQYFADGVRFAAYAPTTRVPQPSWPMLTPGTTVTEKQSCVDIPTKIPGHPLKLCRNYALVDPGASGGGVTVSFASDQYASTGIRSFGLYVQNGDTHADATGSFGRRPFRLTAFDEGGNEIHQFRWYTAQDRAGGGFYGITSDTPIYSVRINVQDGTDPFTVDDLWVSPSYVDMTARLGWRADGAWTQSNNGGAYYTYDHANRKSYQLAAAASGDYSQNFSGGTHWVAAHAGSASLESKLTSPAFTLSNLDLDEDDLTSFDVWAIGIGTSYDTDPATSAIESMSDSDLAWCTIPFLCNVDPWKTLAATPTTFHSSTAQTHWSHVHWQGYIDVESGAQYDNTASTARYVEYSTDNGATWRNAWWWRDENHRGSNGKWWNNHMHPFMDSYMNGDADRDGTVEHADFNKNGLDAADSNFDWDQDGAGGYLDGDADDIREWDTEFYMEYQDPPAGGTLDGYRNYSDKNIEGASIVYRFRFATNGVGGTWKIDDVALSSDVEDVDYFTDFDTAAVADN